MKKKQYWYVIQTHSAQQYNDIDDYEIKNGEGNTVVKYHKRDILETVCFEHNLCFLEEQK